MKHSVCTWAASHSQYINPVGTFYQFHITENIHTEKKLNSSLSEVITLKPSNFLIEVSHYYLSEHSTNVFVCKHKLVKEIILHINKILWIVISGDTDKLVELLLEGYDHITDIVDDDDIPIAEAVSKANQPHTVSFLQSILTFEVIRTNSQNLHRFLYYIFHFQEKRERVHHVIRQGSFNDVKTLLADENETGSGKLLAIGKNNYGRCSLHIAVLCQQEEIVDYLATTFPETLKLGDNVSLYYILFNELVNC